MSHLSQEVPQKQTAAAFASHSIFASATRLSSRTPYPHLVVEEALPPAIADVLLAEMPPLDVVLQGQEPGRSSLHAALASCAEQSSYLRHLEGRDPRLPRCVTGRSRSDAQALRGELIELFPDFETRFGPIDELRAVPRYGPRAHNEVGMDARIVVNSPPLTDGTSVRGPHLDIPNKLISALLNLRPEHDDSIGGELDLYEPAGGSLRFVDGNAAAPGTVRPRCGTHTGLLTSYRGVPPKGACP